MFLGSISQALITMVLAVVGVLLVGGKGARMDLW